MNTKTKYIVRTLNEGRITYGYGDTLAEAEEEFLKAGGDLGHTRPRWSRLAFTFPEGLEWGLNDFGSVEVRGDGEGKTVFSYL